ncbi:outer membrane protein [Oceanisphaera sp. W20_SRM_FM3]|uniref:outer membrane protein n=1 Tax=Oceanisphaera sp. W20_SRM_FM3 TaxID=3240267 RepID=UPI003F9800BB
MRLNYKNFLSNCAILSFTAATSSVALAADLDASWGGLYGGITIGALNGEADPDTTTTDGSYFRTQNINKLNNTFQKDVSGSTATASALVGYLKQNNNFLYGIEADLTVMGFNEKTSTTTGYANGAGENNTETSIKSNFSLAIRPTIGYSFGDTMVQFGAGPVISQFDYKFNFSDFSDISTSTDMDKTTIGVSADIGIKHRFDNDLIIQLDYIYSHYSNIVDSNSLLTNASGSSTNTDVFSHGSEFESNNIRIGLIKYF